MKLKTIMTLVAVGATAGAAFGYPAESEPETLTLVGITNNLSYLPLAIGHDEPGTDGGKITVRNVIQTAQLSVGDELYVYDHTAMQYNLFKLDISKNEDGFSAKNWVPQPSVVVETIFGNVQKRESVGLDTPLDSGYGLWLHRRGGTSATVWAMGAAATNIVTEVPVGGYALVGVPGRVDFVDLADLSTFPSSCEFVNGDQIQVPLDGEKGGLERHEYFDGKWYHMGGKPENRKICRGQAFWYLHVTGASKAVIFNW